MLKRYTNNHKVPETNQEMATYKAMTDVDMNELQEKMLYIDNHKRRQTKNMLETNEIGLMIRTLEKQYNSIDKVPDDNYLLSVLKKGSD